MATEVRTVEAYLRCKNHAEKMGLKLKIMNGDFVVLEEGVERKDRGLYQCGIVDRLSSWLQGFEAVHQLDIKKRNKMMDLIMDAGKKEEATAPDPFASSAIDALQAQTLLDAFAISEDRKKLFNVTAPPPAPPSDFKINPYPAGILQKKPGGFDPGNL